MRDKKRDSKYKNSNSKNILKKGSSVRKKKKFNIKSMLSEFKILSLKSNMDLPFLFLVLTILVIGLVMMFSASYPNAYYLHKGDSFYFNSSQPHHIENAGNTGALVLWVSTPPSF